MKITRVVVTISALLLAAGCATDQHRARYDATMSPAYSSGRMSDYNNNEVMGNAAAGKSGAQSDNAIVAAVRESLQRDPEIAPIVPNVQVSANNGAVVLNGLVQSEEQKRQIESLAQRARGVAAVNNQLQILANPTLNMENQPGNNLLLNSTSRNSNSLPRLYKNSADGADASTNSVLDPTSLPGGADRIYHQNGQDQNTNSNLR